MYTYDIVATSLKHFSFSFYGIPTYVTQNIHVPPKMALGSNFWYCDKMLFSKTYMLAFSSISFEMASNVNPDICTVWLNFVGVWWECDSLITNFLIVRSWYYMCLKRWTCLFNEIWSHGDISREPWIYFQIFRCMLYFVTLELSNVLAKPASRGSSIHHVYTG